MTTDNQAQRDAQVEWLRRAAEVAETLTDEEILALGRRLRRTTAEWLRMVATHGDDPYVDLVNGKPAEWVMRLLLEQRGFTLQSIQLGSRSMPRDGSVERDA